MAAAAAAASILPITRLLWPNGLLARSRPACLTRRIRRHPALQPRQPSAHHLCSRSKREPAAALRARRHHADPSGAACTGAAVGICCCPDCRLRRALWMTRRLVNVAGRAEELCGVQQGAQALPAGECGLAAADCWKLRHAPHRSCIGAHAGGEGQRRQGDCVRHRVAPQAAARHQQGGRRRGSHAGAQGCVLAAAWRANPGPAECPAELPASSSCSHSPLCCAGRNVVLEQKFGVPQVRRCCCACWCGASVAAWRMQKQQTQPAHAQLLPQCMHHKAVVASSQLHACMHVHAS